MHFLIYYNSNKKRAEELINILKKLLVNQKVTIIKLQDIKKTKLPSQEKFDIGISVGGDGTFVSLVRNFHDKVSMFMGVNDGMIGFLTEITPVSLKSYIKKILKGEFITSRRNLLSVSLQGGKKIRQFFAVNDAYLLRSQNKGMVQLYININDEGSSFSRGDGIIVSTATGSTAYSLAAGGPIIYPELNAYVITHINSHSLGHKPIVMPEGTFVEIKPAEDRPRVSLFLDGHIVIPLKTEHSVRVELSSKKYSVILLDRNFFFNNLSRKLHWR